MIVVKRYTPTHTTVCCHQNATLAIFLTSLLRCLRNRDKVQLMVMGLSESYRNIVRKYFSNATIVVDRFHLLRLIKSHLLNLWKLYDQHDGRNRGLISLMRQFEDDAPWLS
ncbi:MAG: transposase [Granulosicoccus sp.]